MNVPGHTYTFQGELRQRFSFETTIRRGTFVPPHIHPTQDEFIYVLEGTFDLYLDGDWLQATPATWSGMPKGKPHAYYNRTDRAQQAIFLGEPGRKLKELFDQLHDLTDPEEVVRPLRRLRGRVPAAGRRAGRVSRPDTDATAARGAAAASTLRASSLREASGYPADGVAVPAGANASP